MCRYLSSVSMLLVWLQIKPLVNQVNLESCCVMPKDLVEYAKENDIQLLTHNDPKGRSWVSIHKEKKSNKNLNQPMRT